MLSFKQHINENYKNLIGPSSEKKKKNGQTESGIFYKNLMPLSVV